MAARFCPVLFKLEEVEADANPLPIDLPYRMVLAVASKDSITLYDTQVHQRLGFEYHKVAESCHASCQMTKNFEESDLEC